MATTGQRKKKGVTPIIEESTIADIVETQRNGEVTQTIKYQAPIKENETAETNDENENQDENFDDENIYQNQLPDFGEIPKDKIDVFFDNIETALAHETESFYIRVLRMPDNFDDSFYYPCRDLTSFGIFGCRLTERYKITELLQKKNNNSGGRFNLVALDANQQPLLMLIGYEYQGARNQRIPQTAPVIARDVYIINPVREEITTTGASSDVTKILEVMQAQHREFMQALNSRGQSEIEKLLLTKAVDMITNPPQIQNNGIESFLEKLVLLPQISQRLGDAMFPKPPAVLPPSEKTTFDKVMEVANMPVVQNVIERFTDVAEAVAAAKLQPQLVQQPAQAQQTAPVQQNPQALNGQPNQQQDGNKEMQIIIQSLVSEIESENPIDNTNQTIISLREIYPQHFNLVTMLCKNAEFDDVLSTLLSESITIKPYPFAPFIDSQKMQETGNTQYYYTERGEKAIERLKLVYKFLRES